MSAIWQDEEDRPPISIFWASPCFAGDNESYNPLWNLERSTGHVPHTIANIYYPELSGYSKVSKPSSESVPIQEPTPLEGPLYEHENTNPCGTTGENNQNVSSRKISRLHLAISRQRCVQNCDNFIKSYNTVYTIIINFKILNENICKVQFKIETLYKL